MRGPGRREIGHGVLAERAISSVLPSAEEFPYTVRVVSDILESNGSSSMATVCGGILALQDAGVPIRTPVAGIAMGLVKEDERYAILSDIAGAEDHYGDMDFKVAGSQQGIMALQMDIKIGGITQEILSQALEQARLGRLHILDKMAETLAQPRVDISAFAPRIVTMNIPVDKIGGVIGPGGKVIRGIIEETGVKIDIEDDGTVKIFSMDPESSNLAKRRVEEITATAEVGKTYLGKVVKVVDFGAFVEIFPGTEGLLHISEVANRRIPDIRSEIEVGDKILVKCLQVDNQGKIRLSRRAVLNDQRGGSDPDRGGQHPAPTRMTDGLRQALKDFKAGKQSEDQLLELIRELPYEDLGFAKVDHHRALRQGFPEVIFGRGKTNSQIIKIAEALLARHPNLLITAANRQVQTALAQEYSHCRYHEACGAISVHRQVEVRGRGKIAIISAGSADIPVAEEAVVTARIMGNSVSTHYDLGVAGIHRVLSCRQELIQCRVAVVVAGMEGALPSVVGGLLAVPVIAVPTSIGYGASFGGLAALLGMLNSCAANVTVVNIDNGFGAGFVASLINRD